jgi:hypothetical protein
MRLMTIAKAVVGYKLMKRLMHGSEKRPGRRS